MFWDSILYIALEWLFFNPLLRYVNITAELLSVNFCLTSAFILFSCRLAIAVCLLEHSWRSKSGQPVRPVSSFFRVNTIDTLASLNNVMRNTYYIRSIPRAAARLMFPKSQRDLPSVSLLFSLKDASLQFLVVLQQGLSMRRQANGSTTAGTV